MKTLVLSKTNVVNDGNNSRFRYQFSTPMKFENGDKIALSNAQIPYSNFNIMERYRNNKFIYVHSAVPSPYNNWTVQFPDGFFSVEDMNYFLQQVMIENGHYLVNGDGENVYYIKISTNSQRYRIQLDFFVVPSVLPTGWSNPSGWNLAVYGGRTFGINFLKSRGSFPLLIGFSYNLYGFNYTTNQAVLGDNIPSPALVNSYMITIPTLITQSNVSSNYLSAIYAMTPNVDFGNNIIAEPYQMIFVDVNPGTYSYFDVILCSGDDGSQLLLQDNNSLIFLVLKSRDE